jgi:hypothetical protein
MRKLLLVAFWPFVHGVFATYQDLAIEDLATEELKALAVILLGGVNPAARGQVSIQRHGSNVFDLSRYAQSPIRRSLPKAQATNVANGWDVEPNAISKKATKLQRKLSPRFPHSPPTVAIEILGDKHTDEDTRKLSRQLRLQRLSSMWTDSVATLTQLNKDQERIAQEGYTFDKDPGEVCPVIFNGDVSAATAALAAGATAIVLDASKLDEAADIQGEIVWRISSADEAKAVIDADRGLIFILAEGVSFEEVSAALPKEAMLICPVGPMQPSNAELGYGTALRWAGCRSLLVKSACIGDDEDLEYAEFAIQNLK